MRGEFKELPDLSFAIDEVSAGIYRVVGRDLAGRTVEATDPRLKTLIERFPYRQKQFVESSNGSHNL
jgi:hypothetical protein